MGSKNRDLRAGSKSRNGEDRKKVREDYDNTYS